MYRYAVTAGLALALALAGCKGGAGGSASGGPNRPPAFTSAATVSVPDGGSGTVYTAAASDPDGQPLTFAISGGADRALFAITAAGALSFVSPPDFATPRDADRNNVYLVEISASDGMATTTLQLSVTVIQSAAGGFRVRRVSAAFNQPVYLAPLPDGSGRVLVVQRGGLIRVLTPSAGTIAATPLLDVSAEISTDGERGLLGFAAAPDFSTSGTFYVFLTNPAGSIEIRRYRTFTADRTRADPTTREILLTIPHPTNSNHNGGWIDFGNDGFLYIAVGDGGGAGDPDNNGQNTSVLLAKILRIDVSRDGFPADAARNYAIPAGNPFAAGGGAPEIWAYGVRNPFRNSFDRTTGNLLLADVGQDTREEVDLLRPSDGGANLGWSQIEGTQPLKGPVTSAYTLPVAEYGHGTGPRQGNAIIGGYVYRGPIAALRGNYFFADEVTPNIWSLPVARLVPGTTLTGADFTIRTAAFAPNAGAFTNIDSFGEDEAGNLYIVDIDGEIFVVEPTL